ncbi:unnamed protein product [Gadus morhua 'NCC']
MASHTVDDSTSAGAVEMDPMPGYVDLITKASTVMYGALRDCSACGLELSKRTLLDNAYITWNEIFLFCFCAFLWTQIRQGLTECLFKCCVALASAECTARPAAELLVLNDSDGANRSGNRGLGLPRSGTAHV